MSIITFATSTSDLAYATLPLGVTSSTATSRRAPFVEESIDLAATNTTGIDIEFADQSDFWVSYYAYYEKLDTRRPPFELFDGSHSKLRLNMDTTVLGSMEMNSRPDTTSTPTWVSAYPSVHTIDQDILYRFDVHIVMSETSGLIEFYRDGSLLASFAGQTSYAGNASCNAIRMFHMEDAGTTSAYISALMVADEDTRVLEFVQNSLLADGTLSEFTGGVADVNGAGIDDATKLTATVAATSTFTKTALPPTFSTGWDVVGIGVSARAQSGGSAPTPTRVIALSNSVEASGPDENLTITLSNIQHIFSTNPDTGAPWTIAELDAAEVGIKVG